MNGSQILSEDINSIIQRVFEDGNSPDLEWTNYEIFMSILLGSITLTTILSNSLILYLFCKSRKFLRLPSHYLLANLAVADLLVGLIVMPPLLTLTISPTNKWILGNLVCKLSDYIHFVLCGTSTISMIGVALERYIGISFPLRHKIFMRKRRVLQMIGGIWMISICTTWIPLRVWSIEQNVPNFCLINLRNELMWVITVGIYWIPLLIIVLLYLMIYRKAVQPFASSPRKDSSTSSAPLTSKSKESKELKYLKAKEKQKTLTKKLTVVVGAMTLMFAPVFILFTLCALELRIFSLKMLFLAAWIRYGNSTLNPLLYAFAVPGYRREFFKIFLNEGVDEGADNDSLTTSSLKSLDEEKGVEVVAENQQQHPKQKIVPQTVAQNLGCSNPNVPQSFNVLPRCCTYCEATLSNGVGTEDRIFCSKCFEKFASGKASILDTTISCEIPLMRVASQNEEAQSDSGQTSNRSTLAPAPVLHSLIDEIQAYLQALKEKGADNNSSSSLEIVAKRRTRLLSNLMTKPTITIQQEGRTEGKQREENIKLLRQSVLNPILHARSDLLSCGDTSGSGPTDWEMIKELDEIITQLESTLIQPLLSQSQQTIN